MKALRIYIAGPYSASTDEQRRNNVNAAKDAGIFLVQRGHYPFIPHLTHYVDERTIEIGTVLTWEDYIRWDLEWLKMCEAFLYMGNSPGANIELKAAQEQGLPIYYTVDDIPPVGSC